MMRRCLALGLVLACAPLSAQEAVLRTSGQELTFGNPSGVGLRSYRMISTTLGIAHSFRPWLAAGGTLQHSSARMRRGGVANVSLTGLADAEIFADVGAGPIRLRGTLVLGVGRSSLDSQRLVLAGLAGYEFLPLPARSWGRGGGYAVEGRLPLRGTGIEVELAGSIRSHGSFPPLAEDGADYRLGSETRVGLQMGRRLSALSRVDLGGVLVFPGSDEADGREVFTSGRRMAWFGAVVFPVGRTSVLARGDLYTRAPGDASEAIGLPADSEAAAFATAAVEPGRRSLVAATFDTRTELGLLPLVTTVRARFIDGDEDAGGGWLASLGASTEFEVRGPWPGRMFFAPGARMHRGSASVAEGYDSAVGGWELSLDARWEAGR